MRILLVEDDEFEAQALQTKLIRHLGSDITLFGPYDNFEDVLPHVKRREVDLALIDIQLYEDQHAGIHIAQLIQQFLSVPILFISGITSAEIVQKADKVKFSDFLQKPYDDEGLERAIEWALSRRNTESRDIIRKAFQPRLRDIIWVKTERSTYAAIEWKSIICVEALDQYCRFYLRDNKPITTKANLKSYVLEECLTPYGEFFSLNRSLVVNRMFVEKVVGNELILKDVRSADEQLLSRKLMSIPKERKKEVMRILGISSTE